MYYNKYQYDNGDRQFFFPFLLGGLAGAGLVGVSRPRPVFVTSPSYQQPPFPGPMYPPYQGPIYRPGGYYNYSSGGYY